MSNLLTPTGDPSGNSRETPQQFSKFAELPQELQIEIWKFAALHPQLIEFQQCARRRRDYYKIVIASKFHPLLSTTFKSRQIALEAFGDPYLVGDYQPGFWRNDINTRSPVTRYTMHLDPGTHTLFFPNYDVLYQYRLWYSITQDQTRGGGSFHFAKSLAIGDIIVPSDTSLVDRWSRTSSLLDGHIVFESLTAFVGLEELIFVSPVISRSLISGYNTKSVPELVEEACKADPPSPQEYERRIQDMMIHASEFLRDHVASHRRYHNLHKIGRRDQRGQFIPTSLSKWWDNPIITVMTYEEFWARFN